MYEEIIKNKEADGYGTVTTELIQVGSSLYNTLEPVLKPFFIRYDEDGSGSIDLNELNLLMKDIGQRLSQEEIREQFAQFDADHSGQIDFQEFVTGLVHYAKERQQNLFKKERISEFRPSQKTEEDDDDEVEEVPEDLLDLSPEEQQKRIKMRSFTMMAIGTGIVLLFSDPMVGVLSELGTRTGIKSFYVAFVLGPIASNASELVAAYNYALKKTSKTIGISLSTLYGAAIMNNTFSLAIFLGLVAFKNLAWEFSAETISILFGEIFMFLFAFKDFYRLIDTVPVAFLYPFSIAFVALMEYGGLN